MKKKMISIASFLFIFSFSTHIYASTVLDSNLIDLIKLQVNNISSVFIEETADDMETIETKYLNETIEFVSSKTDSILIDLETHKNDELSRSTSELDAFMNQLENETNSVISEETEIAKNKITERVDSDIENIQNEILKQLEKEIKENMNKKK